MGFRIAVVGATGAVGREMLNILYERQYPVDTLHALASERSIGREAVFGDQKLPVESLSSFDFAGCHLALFSAGSAISEKYAPRAGKAGCMVIDNSSRWRMDPEVPLVVPEVNADAVAGSTKRNLIANPNCSTAQLVVALKPIHDQARIRRVVVSTYQSTSGAGKNAMDELFNQTRAIFVNETVKPTHFTKQIAFNVIPHIDTFMEDGATREEWKMMVETKKILDKKIKLAVTCVRVPTFVGHAEAVNVELEAPLAASKARELLREAPGLMVVDNNDDGGYITPIDCVGDYATFVSRIREDATVENGLNLWVVSDNLRKGAALNAVQIAETLINKGILKE